MAYLVESDFIIRAVDRPFPQRNLLGSFTTAEQAYQFVDKYLASTKDLHTYFSRQMICTLAELPDHIAAEQIVAFNIVLGQFEDMIYIRKVTDC
jgi:hypothetical protein